MDEQGIQLHQEIGRLIEVTSQLRKEVSMLNDRIREIEGKMSTGRGIMIGIVLVAGFLGAQVSDWVKALFAA